MLPRAIQPVVSYLTAVAVVVALPLALCGLAHLTYLASL
jgi:hypothetical protein